MKKQTLRFLVRGNLPFPIDMLRYDRCSPCSEQDSHKIVASFDSNVDTLEIWVQSDDRPLRWRPTIDRWRSFGWTVMAFRCVTGVLPDDH